MNGTTRLREAAEHADARIKTLPDHRLSVRMTVLTYGVLVAARLERDGYPRVTENRKVVSWEEIELAHVNVLVKRIDQLTGEMLGTLSS